MTARVAINGLGRIGRATLKIVLDEPDLDLVAMNDIAPPENLAYLLKYDTAYGRYERSVEAADGSLLIDGRSYKVLSQKDPASLPWRDLDVAYDIIGGGEEGDKTTVSTKEEADHSLPYMVAVALLDGELLPPQYEPARIRRGDVQALLLRVEVRPNDGYSARFPDQMPTSITIRLRDGRSFRIDKTDYEGFHTRPMSWEAVVEKFTKVTKPFTSEARREAIIAAVAGLERIHVRELTAALATLQ